jgi:sugar fermentation stimulation protein A
MPLNDVCYQFPAPLRAGRLIRRYQRFLADVEWLDGQLATVHCPNSGSMLGCLEPGAAVYCSPRPAPRRRTAYTWEMIAIGGRWVGINTQVPNELVAQAAEREALHFFRGALAVRREISVAAHTRLDMLVERRTGPIYVEVKNVTLVRDGRAQFPDAATARGAKHLAQLTALAGAGVETALVYVVQRQDGTAFAPAEDIDPRYAALYKQARVSPESIQLVRELPLLQ